MMLKELSGTRDESRMVKLHCSAQSIDSFEEISSTDEQNASVVYGLHVQLLVGQEASTCEGSFVFSRIPVAMAPCMRPRWRRRPIKSS